MRITTIEWGLRTTHRMKVWSLLLALFGFTSQGAAQIEFLCEPACVVGSVGCGETEKSLGMVTLTVDRETDDDAFQGLRRCVVSRDHGDEHGHGQPEDHGFRSAPGPRQRDKLQIRQ